MTLPAVSQTTAPRTPLLFVAAAVWVAISMTAGRVAATSVPAAYSDLAQEAAIALLLFGGFYLIAKSSVPDLRPLSSVGFVIRPGTEREFGLGVALGWAIAIVLMLPALLTGNLHLGLTLDVTSVLLTLRSGAVLLLFALNAQMVLAGLPARLLLRIAGPGWTAAAIVLMAPIIVFLGEPGRNLLFIHAGRRVVQCGLSANTRCVAAAWPPDRMDAESATALRSVFTLYAAQRGRCAEPGWRSDSIDRRNLRAGGVELRRHRSHRGADRAFPHHARLCLALHLPAHHRCWLRH